jgi:hypothetical protein
MRKGRWVQEDEEEERGRRLVGLCLLPRLSVFSSPPLSFSLFPLSSLCLDKYCTLIYRISLYSIQSPVCLWQHDSIAAMLQCTHAKCIPQMHTVNPKGESHIHRNAYQHASMYNALVAVHLTEGSRPRSPDTHQTV